ncbi:hypothetical protein [Streptomyces europaeiscabiei]|uniref:hypothetical protein n=1 Tax=Streptomyces europaeiscabiei TaxID=146819 RepID=UPI002E2AD9EA|nr:hypothetical protein [Streptomyces europaeiscabiei]
MIDANLLPAELREMAIYYQAKAQRDLGRSAASRNGMQSAPNVAAASLRLLDAVRLTWRALPVTVPPLW